MKIADPKTLLRHGRRDAGPDDDRRDHRPAPFDDPLEALRRDRRVEDRRRSTSPRSTTSCRATASRSSVPSSRAFGLELSKFFIENVSLPEEVEAAIDQRTKLGVLGDRLGQYTQLQAADAMKVAAANPGGVAGVGVGLGAGRRDGRGDGGRASAGTPARGGPPPAPGTAPPPPPRRRRPPRRAGRSRWTARRTAPTPTTPLKGDARRGTGRAGDARLASGSRGLGPDRELRGVRGRRRLGAGAAASSAARPIRRRS